MNNKQQIAVAWGSVPRAAQKVEIRMKNNEQHTYNINTALTFDGKLPDPMALLGDMQWAMTQLLAEKGMSANPDGEPSLLACNVTLELPPGMPIPSDGDPHARLALLN
jgi:hypothetical protein